MRKLRKKVTQGDTKGKRTKNQRRESITAVVAAKGGNSRRGKGLTKA